MKIAVCISGSTKHINSSLISIERLKSIYDIDVFIHTWRISDFNKFNECSGSKNTSFYCPLEIIKAYNPVKFIIEDYSDAYEYFKNKMEDYNYNTYYNDSIGPLSMFYSMYNCNLIKNSYYKKYDMNIRMRFDSKINSDIQILEKLDKSFLHIPQEMDYNGIHDQFAFGNTELMNMYCNVINDIEKTDRSVYHPEKILYECLTYNSVPINRFAFSVGINGGPSSIGINNI